MAGTASVTGLVEHLDEPSAESRFSAAMRERSMQAPQPQAELDPPQRRQAQEALARLERRKAELAPRLWAASRGGDRRGAAGLHQRLRQLHERGQDLLRHLGGGALERFAGEARGLNRELMHGRRAFADLTPPQANRVVAFHTGRPVAELLDTRDGPGPVGRQLQAFREGLAALRQDGGSRLLRAVNGLWGHELDGLLGQHAYDGSTVTAAAFAAPVPHPHSAAHLMLTARLTTRSPDGRSGTLYVPLTEDHGQLLAHPDEVPHARVKSFSLAGLMHRFGELDTIHQALNNHPAVWQKLIEGYLQGHDQASARMLDWLRVLGHDAGEWAPRHALAHDLADDEAPSGGGLRGPGPVPVGSAAEAARLPSGTLFRTPDGRTIRRH
jgi:hypothetical protein